MGVKLNSSEQVRRERVRQNEPIRQADNFQPFKYIQHGIDSTLERFGHLGCE
jgi:hypothetical protein